MSDDSSTTYPSSDEELVHDAYTKLDEKRSQEARLLLHAAFYPLLNDERETFLASLKRDEGTTIQVMPNHHVDAQGNLRGFRFTVDPETGTANFPVNREMFFGTTICEVLPMHNSIHPKAFQLLQNFSECKKKLLHVIRKVTASQNEAPNFSCIPEALQEPEEDNEDLSVEERIAISERRFEALHTGHLSAMKRFRDAKEWPCDVPQQFGLYHAHVRNRDTGLREHKLFISTTGGCRAAAQQFHNLYIDLLGSATVSELATCEEAWWLKRTSTRTRLRFNDEIAKALELTVESEIDVNAHDENRKIPIATTNCFSHDIVDLENGKVGLYNECCDTTAARNGVVCIQEPAEGIWIFQGPQQFSSPLHSNFGAGFGDQFVSGTFPSGVVASEKERFEAQNTSTRLNIKQQQASEHVFYYDPVTGKEVEPETLLYTTRFDETFLKHLEAFHSWERAGAEIVQLIPICVGCEWPK
jgi:hypothetical protein